VRRDLEWRVRFRAGNRCQYCRMPEAYDIVRFHVDQVIARQHGGRTVLENLALSCAYCNAHKGPNLSGIDPKTRRLARLFHPVNDRWQKHFRSRGARIVGLTPTGRATVAVLGMNDPVNVNVRAALIEEGVW
jgi:hypothetical protein